MPLSERQMAAFPTYDPTTDTISLNGCASIMLTLLMKAKFGEKFDSEVLFHERVAELVRQLDHSLGGTCRPAAWLSRADLYEIANGVFHDSFQSGWWSKTAQQREQYLQDAAAPWVLSTGQIQDITDDIESLLFRARQITSKAASAGEP